MRPTNKGSPKIGVYICHCGTNIAGTVDVEAVARHAASLGNVRVSSSLCIHVFRPRPGSHQG